MLLYVSVVAYLIAANAVMKTNVLSVWKACRRQEGSA